MLIQILSQNSNRQWLHCFLTLKKHDNICELKCELLIMFLCKNQSILTVCMTGFVINDSCSFLNVFSRNI